MMHPLARHPLARLGVCRLRFKNMFGGSPQMPAQPQLTPPPTMPDPWGPAAREAARRAGASAGKGGRASTVLTRGAGSTGSAPNYVSTTLGGGH